MHFLKQALVIFDTIREKIKELATHPSRPVSPVFDYLVIIRKKIWMMGLIFSLVLGLTALATFKQRPIYQSTCKIRYKKAGSFALGAGGSPFYWLNPYYDSITFETEKYIIKGPDVTEGVVEKLGLASPENPSDFKSWTRRVQSALTVKKEKDTRIYLIQVRYPEPDLAQAIANAIAEVYIEQSLGEKKESAQKSFATLTSQIADLKSLIEKSRTALIEYIKKEGAPEIEPLLPPDSPADLTSSQVSSIRSQLHSQLVQLKIKRGQYLIKYKEKHPRVQEVERQMEVLSGIIKSEEESINRARKKAIEYGILERKAQVNEELYNILLKKLAELDLSKEGIESNIDIIGRAERPGAPISPRKRRNLTLGAFLGLVLGLGAVFATEYFNPTLQTPDEAESYLDLPVLASIPRMLTPPDMGKEETVDFLFQISERSPRSHESEMFKHLRTNIRFSDFGATTLALLVTSSSPREGKTTVATNLGITTAHAGSKTILVDTDLRRPAMDRIFNLKEPIGLASYLKGEASLEEIIYPSMIKRLSIIPAGGTPPNPTELLESPRLGQMIERLKEKFDRIILDSPPAGALADALIIGSLTDGVILVCFAGYTDKKFVLRTKQQLEKGGAKIYGVVLNYIELKLRSYYYYYHSVYKYGYR